MAIYKTVSTQSENPIKVIETSATTYGELKADLASAGIKYEGMAVTIKSTKNTLSFDDAILPEGDQVLYITPTNVKSGYFSEEEFDDMYSSEERLAALAGAIQEHVSILESKINALIRGVQQQAAAIGAAASMGVVERVVELEETPALSAEDQADLDAARELAGL